MSVENQQDYLAISAGSDGNESYYYFEAPMDGFTLVETETRDTNEGSLYMWYHADSNSMYLSTTGFKTEDAHVWNVLGDSVFTDWLSPVNVFIGTGSDGDPINGDIAWLDNFKMVRGTLNDWPPVTDLDINGFIDLDDIAVLVYYWLTDPNGLPDFDNDGTVNLTDLAELTNAY
jgi:hypothetical protein